MKMHTFEMHALECTPLECAPDGLLSVFCAVCLCFRLADQGEGPLNPAKPPELPRKKSFSAFAQRKRLQAAREHTPSARAKGQAQYGLSLAKVEIAGGSAPLGPRYSASGRWAFRVAAWGACQFPSRINNLRTRANRTCNLVVQKLANPDLWSRSAAYSPPRVGGTVLPVNLLAPGRKLGIDLLLSLRISAVPHCFTI